MDLVFIQETSRKIIEKNKVELLKEQTNKIEEVKNLIKEKQIKYIYSTTSKTNNTVKELIDNNNLEQISMNTMHSTDGNITNSNDNYLTIMTNNINELKKELYK